MFENQYLLLYNFNIMISKVLSALPIGYDGAIIEVEGDMNKGLPAFNIVGMGSKTISESRDRVRSAIVNSMFSFPNKKVTINLAPAELHKDGAYLDLPIALATLILSNQLLQSDVKDKLFVGELSLDGALRPIRGIINIVEVAKKARTPTIFVPIENFSQASLVSGIEIIGVSSLKELFLHLKNEQKIINSEITMPTSTANSNSTLLDHIRGQKQAKRALQIAIAGRHNILINGPPGAGKTLLAKAATNLLPKPSSSEQVAITKIHSLGGISDDIVTERPFRAPHHTASTVSIIGGGANAQPGEISLAHHGVLFLDELPEYPRSILESLRQPLEDKKITVSRANAKTSYPADFMLIATMNPCPCGFLGSPDHECTCTPQQIHNYSKKLSGPLLDRIDILIDVAKVDNSDLLKTTTPTSIEHNTVRQSIERAILVQHARFNKNNFYNSNLTSHQVSKMLHLTNDALALLAQASDKLSLSARAYFKIIKVAQTIADLDSSVEITPVHLSEALQYRRK